MLVLIIKELRNIYFEIYADIRKLFVYFLRKIALNP